MESRQALLPLVDPTPQTRWLSGDCALHRDGELVTVSIGGSPLFRFDAGSQIDARLVAAVLGNAKAAPIHEILDAFELDDATLWRVRERLQKSGVAGLLKGKPGPKGPTKLISPVVRRIITLRREKKLPSRAIAAQLRMSHTAVLAALRAAGGGLSEDKAVATDRTPPLPFGDDPVLPESPATTQTKLAVPATVVTEGAPSQLNASLADSPRSATVPALPAVPAVDSTVLPASAPSVQASVPPLSASKRAATPEEAVLYARLGLSYDGEAEVVFEPQAGLPGAGFLLAIPVLAATGLFDAARRAYGSLKPGVYGLRATMLVLALIVLLRRPRPENLKGADPASLGDVIGLLRAPEVKTIRRKLTEVAGKKKAHALLEELARRWLAERKDELGTLYIDGHVRDYHGEHKLPKTHISQRNLCGPATTEYWVNGVDGEPVYVVTANANAAMTKMLLDVIDRVEKLTDGRKGTIVFDRGGWSPKLFKDILDKKWHILTYRKGKIRKHPRRGFKVQSQVIDGKERRYTLSERNVRLSNGLKLREIAELREDGGQTIILTSHFGHPAVLLAFRMFGRWRQENFFKYMKENFALDALVDYNVEPDDLHREVPNPAWKALDKKLKAARAKLAKQEREYGAAAVANAESRRPTMRGFKIANGDIGKALRDAKDEVHDLECKRGRLPKRVTVAEAIGVDEVVKLSVERKLFTDVIKTACYRAETALLRLLVPHFPRAEDEGRALLNEVMKQPADLHVNGDDVIIRYAPMSAPRYTASLAALCEELNALEPRFPETTYRLHYEVVGPAK